MVAAVLANLATGELADDALLDPCGLPARPALEWVWHHAHVLDDPAYEELRILSPAVRLAAQQRIRACRTVFCVQGRPGRAQVRVGRCHVDRVGERGRWC